MVSDGSDVFGCPCDIKTYYKGSLVVVNNRGSGIIMFFWDIPWDIHDVLTNLLLIYS